MGQGGQWATHFLRKYSRALMRREVCPHSKIWISRKFVFSAADGGTANPFLRYIQQLIPTFRTVHPHSPTYEALPPRLPVIFLPKHSLISNCDNLLWNNFQNQCHLHNEDISPDTLVFSAHNDLPSVYARKPLQDLTAHDMEILIGRPQFIS